VLSKPSWATDWANCRIGVDLLGAHEALRVVVVHAAAQEQLEQLGSMCWSWPHLRHDRQRLGQGLARFVRAVGGGQRLEDVGDRHHARRRAHLVACQAARVAGAVHLLVVAAGDLRHAAQMAREGQLGSSITMVCTMCSLIL
jgi:acetyl esterase/lipase